MKKKIWIIGSFILLLTCSCLLIYWFATEKNREIEEIALLQKMDSFKESPGLINIAITRSLTDFQYKLAYIFFLVFIIFIFLAYFGFKIWKESHISVINKNGEEELLNERSLLRTLIDNLPSGVFFKDTHYRKILANRIHIDSMQCYLKTIGLNPNTEIIGKTDFEVYPNEIAMAYWEDDRKVIEDGFTQLNQIENGIGPNGEKIWLLVSKVPIHDKNEAIIGMVGITTDFTKRKLIEDELFLAKEKAEESDKLKSAFLNNISHEIRTPINAIIGFTGLLNDPNLTEDKKTRYIEIIKESSNQLLLIITDIIHIATIEAGQIKVTVSMVNINTLFPILIEQYRAKAEAKKLILSYTMPLPYKDATIYTDYIKLVEILSNLINNAIKFTEQGHIKFGYELKGNQLEFYVEDTGIGIRKEFHELIFNRFFQTDDRLSKNKGTGLGLSISKAYVEALGGNIWLTSKPDFGTTFYFTLPYGKLENTASMNPA